MGPKDCGFKPRCDQHVVPLSKALYHYYSTLLYPGEEMGTGILQCWEGNRLAGEEVIAIPSQQGYNRCESGPFTLREEMGTPFLCV